MGSLPTEVCLAAVGCLDLHTALCLGELIYRSKEKGSMFRGNIYVFSKNRG